MRCSRPCFSRATNPASSSTRTCLLTAGSDMSNGEAISVTLAGPFASRVNKSIPTAANNTFDPMNPSASCNNPSGVTPPDSADHVDDDEPS